MIQYTNMYKVIRQVTLKQLMLLQLLPRIRQNLRIHSRLDAYTYIIFFFSMPVRHCLPFTHFPYDFGKNKRRANMLFSLLFHHRLRRRRRCRRSNRTKWYCRCVCLYERHTSFVKPIIIGFIHAYKSTTRVKITLFSSIQVLLIFTSFYSVCSVVMCVCVYICVFTAVCHRCYQQPRKLASIHARWLIAQSLKGAADYERERQSIGVHTN